ncbi:MAG: hypothetical protein ACXU86_01800, partial [Archangium sp.]
MNILRSFQGKLLLFFLLVDIVMVGLLVATVSSGAREALEASNREHLLELAHLTSSDIDEQLELRWSALRSLAANPIMTQGVLGMPGGGDAFGLLMRQLALPGRGGEAAELWLLDSRGRVIASNEGSQVLGSFADEIWWPQVREGVPQALVVSERGRPRVLFASPIVLEGHL